MEEPTLMKLTRMKKNKIKKSEQLDHGFPVRGASYQGPEEAEGMASSYCAEDVPFCICELNSMEMKLYLSLMGFQAGECGMLRWVVLAVSRCQWHGHSAKVGSKHCREPRASGLQGSHGTL